VTFDIDASGILNVAAKDTATGRFQSIRITGSTRLPEDVKKRMIDEAERYAEADKKRREDADAINAADSMSYQAEKTLADFGDKIDADLKARIESVRAEVREAVSKKDASLAREKSERLAKLLKEAGTAIYASPQAGAGQPTEPPPGARGSQGGHVVDADYRETR